jgi:hypothetical protein
VCAHVCVGPHGQGHHAAVGIEKDTGKGHVTNENVCPNCVCFYVCAAAGAAAEVRGAAAALRRELATALCSKG